MTITVPNIVFLINFIICVYVAKIALLWTKYTCKQEKYIEEKTSYANKITPKYADSFHFGQGHSYEGRCVDNGKCVQCSAQM